jgi:predicted transcriptional regulator
MTKQNVVSVLNELPNNFIMDDLLEKLAVIEKIDKGLQEVKEGKTVSHEEVKNEVHKWLK